MQKSIAMETSRPITIGLQWHAFGIPNLGVDALSRSNIEIIRQACTRVNLIPSFILYSKPGGIPPQGINVYQGPYLRVRSLFFGGMFAYVRALNRCDLIIDICAGDGFTDIYGAFELLLHFTTKFGSIFSGKIFIFAPQTIGPFRWWWSKWLATWILNRVYATFVRDDASAIAFKELGARGEPRQVIDVALSLPFVPYHKSPNNTKVGINISGLLLFQQDRFRLTLNYEDLMRRILKGFSEMETEIWLVPHVLNGQGSQEHDDAASEIFLKEFPNLNVAPEFRDSIEAKSFISGFDFFVGGRMHACIAALSSGVPVIPISYSRKFNGLFETLQYKHIVDARVSNIDEAERIIMDGFTDRLELINDVNKGMDLANQRILTYQSNLEDMLRHLFDQTTRPIAAR